MECVMFEIQLILSWLLFNYRSNLWWWWWYFSEFHDWIFVVVFCEIWLHPKIVNEPRHLIKCDSNESLLVLWLSFLSLWLWFLFEKKIRLVKLALVADKLSAFLVKSGDRPRRLSELDLTRPWSWCFLRPVPLPLPSWFVQVFALNHQCFFFDICQPIWNTTLQNRGHINPNRAI